MPRLHDHRPACPVLPAGLLEGRWRLRRLQQCVPLLAPQRPANPRPCPSDHRAVNGGEYRAGKDANSVLTSIHNFDPAVGCDPVTFQPCSDKALSNHKALVDSFRDIYQINSGIAPGKAAAVGRYSEDVYYNGNPWFLTTFAAAEQLYDAIYVWKQQGSVEVTDLSLAFFRDLLPDITTGTYEAGSSTYDAILDAVFAYADGFIEVAAKYAAEDGSLTEQYDRNTGKPIAAPNLTWSYSAFLTATARRAGIVPSGWGAENANKLPDSCSGVQVAGTYKQATKTTFPPNQTPNPTASAVPVPYPTQCTNADEVYVTFNQRATTQWGETIKVVGSTPELGGWDVSKAVPLSASAYRANDPLWAITVPMRAGSRVEYKYIRVQSDGSVQWESDPNRSFTVSASGANADSCKAMTRNDSWR